MPKYTYEFKVCLIFKMGLYPNEKIYKIGPSQNEKIMLFIA